MKKQTYKNKVEKQIEKFRKIHDNLVNLTEEFLKDENNYIDVEYDDTIRKMEQFLFTYAYIVDELSKLSNARYSCSGKEYNKSMLKRVRKILGYTL